AYVAQPQRVLGSGECAQFTLVLAAGENRVRTTGRELCVVGTSETERVEQRSDASRPRRASLRLRFARNRAIAPRQNGPGFEACKADAAGLLVVDNRDVVEQAVTGYQHVALDGAQHRY